MRELPTVKRALNWMWNHADTIGIGCMWLVAAIDLVILRKLDDACVWAMFAIVCIVQTRHRAELDRLRIEANVTREMIGAIVTEQARAVSYDKGGEKRTIAEIIASKITCDAADREPQIQRDDVPDRSEDEIPF